MPNDNKNIQPTTPHLVTSHDVQLDADYTRWLVELKARYRNAQIKAAVRVNAEKLLFNWQLGRDLIIKKAEERWGAGIVEQVALDLQSEFPEDKGFSARNLWDMKKWYLYYTTAEAKEKLRQLVAEITLPLSEEEKPQQAVAEFPSPFALVPWGHHILIMRHAETAEEAIFYIRKTIAEGWSRQTLTNCLNANIYKEQGQALTNFSQQLPEAQSRLAQEIVKDNYDLSFISLRENFEEKELEDALERNMVRQAHQPIAA